MITYDMVDDFRVKVDTYCKLFNLARMEEILTQQEVSGYVTDRRYYLMETVYPQSIEHALDTEPFYAMLWCIDQRISYLASILTAYYAIKRIYSA